MQRSFVVCLCMLLTAVMACAQIGTEGAFFGTVTDASGGFVPGAEVVAVHTTTGLTKRAVTGSDGAFNIMALPIGTYTITVKAKGFKTWETSNADLTVGDRSRITPVLQVGEVTESVTVASDTELLQTEKSSTETIVQMQQIRELPLDTRNPLALVSLVPGMFIAGMQSGGERATYVQGQGLRYQKTAFQLDGVVSNAPMDEGGTGIPNVDTVAEFSVETLNFGADKGRDPMQVIIATKAGTNALHGTLWEFLQNDAFNARNTYASSVPRVRRNQFGGAVGGPIIRNKTFFFGSFQGTVVRNQSVWNTLAVTPAMEQGNFSALSKTIVDPLNKAPFAGNIIPASRISAASAYFLPKLLVANSPDGRFRTNAGTMNNTWEGTGRIDHQITDAQRIYGRYVTVRQPSTQLGYAPTAVTNDTVTQHNVAVNYSWTLSPNSVLTLLGGMLRTMEQYTNDDLGKVNDAAQAGIQGFPTAGREKWIGPPNIGFANGYRGISYSGWGVPGRLYGSVYNAKADYRRFAGAHTLAVGFEYIDTHTYGDHGSCCVRGSFGFYNQYTNDGFADYLLGYTSSSSRNAPLADFGTDRAPYGAFYVNDTYRIRPNLTIDAGLRFERWWPRHNRYNATSTWDPNLNKVVAAVDSSGKINLNAFLDTPGVAAATANVWVTAPQAGYPDSLLQGSNNWAPRIGVVYRPFAGRQIVVRGAYGIFYNSFTGNRSASSAANPPFWGVEGLGFSLSELQPWTTVWSADPNSYGIFGIWEAVDPALKPARTHEWNFTIQSALPWNSALTLSYVGTRVGREVIYYPYNQPVVGPHADLQTDRPNPLFGDAQRLENRGLNWYHAFQTKVERRFAKGVAYTFAYSFSRSMGSGSSGGDEYTTVLPYSPDWYNRGRTDFDYRHVESSTLLWELPIGQGRRIDTGANRLVDALTGGWQLSFTQTGRSGSPLSIGGGYPNLGNGYGSRADIVGNPSVSSQSPAMWFNGTAFSRPALYTWGSSPLGVVDGPGMVQFNTALSKKFRITEGKDLQFRWESFNAFNHVNYGNPSTDITSSDFGQISYANTSRYMQFALKFLF